MQDALLRALAQGALLLTANRRLARHWRIVYDSAQQAAGHTVWPAPAIRVWQDWVSESIDALLPDCLTPSPFAELRGWQKVIDASPLLDHQATAETAAQAWTLCQHYHLSLDHPSFQSTEDTAHFRQWADEFERRAAQHNWLPAAHREQWLAARLPQSHRDVWLDGFDEFTPAQQTLLRKLNWTAYQESAAAAASVTRAVFPSAAKEIEAAAAWCRTLLESGQARSIGIVVQNLARLRPAVEAAFEDILGAPFFNISLGLPLSDWPIVSDALLLLRWLAQPLDIGSVGVLLRSPFLRGAAAERAARALFDCKLRDSNVLELSLSRARDQAPPILSELLGQALIQLRNEPRKLSPGQWARRLPALLIAAGWPGERTQSSPERQALVRWQQLLQEFASLDLVDSPMPFAQAVSTLSRLAAQAIFQPETEEMPIQILEALQAAGSRFDALWIMGMTDTAWPPPARPNPFIPRSLAREHNLPHATPERELRFARDITARLLRSAPTVIFSHAEREGDEELRPSRLIEVYPQQLPAANAYPVYAERAALDESADTTAPALPPGAKVRGGTSILSWQSLCPFQSFARVRLSAEEWTEPKPGLTALERGIALHGALADLWKRYPTRDSLARIADWERQQAIRDAIEVGLSEIPAAGREQLLRLERLRIQRVIEDWIELDFQRDAFTVEAAEHDIDLAPLGLPLKGRIDRIDRLPNGELVLIDYKSTAPSKNVWAGPRPDNLQLPLYALALPETPSAIAFAQLKRGNHKFDGLAAAEGLLPNVKPPKDADWGTQLAAWRTVVDTIWAEFQSGRAGIDPKNNGKPCVRCHLHSLCRIYDTAALPDSESD